MDKFSTLTGVAAPLPMVNVDTDMIIPKQFLKTIKRTGLKDGLFYEMRYAADGKKLDFVLDRPHLWPRRFMAHALWHTLVLAGSACHYVVIARFVAAPV